MFTSLCLSERVLPRTGFFVALLAHSSKSSLRVAYTGSYSSASPPQKGFLQLRSSSAKLFLSPATGGSHSFAPSGTREDPGRRVANTAQTLAPHASLVCAAGRYSLRLAMPACVPCTPCRHSSLREIPPCGAARRSSLLRKHAPFQHSSRSSLRVAYTGSYSSASPPQNCSFLPPPAAVTVLPPGGGRVFAPE